LQRIRYAKIFFDNFGILVGVIRRQVYGLSIGKHPPKADKAQALIAAVAIMLILALFGLVGVSLIGSQAGHAATGLVESTQAFYLAQAGLEWYLQQLVNDSDWTDEEGQAQNFANGSFNIEVSNISSKRIDIKSTGRVTGFDGRDRERYVQVTAKRMPKAATFAVYWGRDTGAWLQLRSATTVNGDFWSRGTTEVLAGNSITGGIAYYASGQDVVGAGSYTKEEVSSPPDMPQIDEVYYNNIMSSFDTYINDYGNNTNRDQSSDLVLNGDIIGCKNFTTTGNITISGHGYIVASQDISLHSPNASSGTLTVTPSGGNIYFLSARSLTVNSTQNDTNVTVNSGTYLYSRAQTGTDQLIRIRKHAATSTNIGSAFIIARRRIIVQSAAQITDSTLYVSDVSDTNNYLQITNSGTLVSGSVISVSGRDPGLIINNGASVTGLVYHWGGNDGYAQLNEATITGSVVASQYTNDRIVDSTITYDAASLPTSLPEGFDDYILIEPGSWDGL
jgi:Tfp pilus assembly protein PilX